jgi:putative intracellular protease/amidase
MRGILMMLTSHDQLGNNGDKTGFWLEEFTARYFVFRDAGVELTLASPKRGQPPDRSKSVCGRIKLKAMTRFKQDAEAQKQLSQTVKLSDRNPRISTPYFTWEATGPMWDLSITPTPSR